MSERDKLSFAALITISLPVDGGSISVPVILTPSDSVSIEGQNKRLADCTLADLRAYAAELEEEVWQAYEAISLPALDDDESIRLEVVLSDESGSPVEEWANQVLLPPLLDSDQETTAADQAETTTDVSAAHETPLFVPDQLTDAGLADPGESEIDDTVGAEEASELGEPDVAVAETELVYPEIEDETPPQRDTTPVSETAVPEIIPSKARVRVAGAQLPIGHHTWAAVDILMDEPALRAAQAHALSSMSREVAGVLVGPRPEKQPDGRYLVHIIDTIAAKYTVMQGASVTYTPESWRYLNDMLAQRYPDETAVMVGWYHTHPGFGIFLSGMDLFIHQYFFTQIWHVAMVLDPRARTSGFFCWDRPQSKVSRCDFSWPFWASGSW